MFGGNVYIDGDITGGRLQIFVFGGNVYIHPDVKNLYANVYGPSYFGVTTLNRYLQ